MAAIGGAGNKKGENFQPLCDDLSG